MKKSGKTLRKNKVVRKKKASIPKRLIRIYLLIITALIALEIVLGFAVLIKMPHQSKEKEIVPTEEEQNKFWVKYLEKPIMGELVSNKYPLPEIQDRYAELSNLILERHGVIYTLSLISCYSDKGRGIFAGCWINDGIPTIELVIPTAFDRLADFKKRGIPNPNKELEVEMVISIIHEMEHLAFDDDNNGPEDLDSLVRYEKGAWARTCQYTIEPLMKRYQYLLSESNQIYYENWVKADRRESHPHWDYFIRYYYGKINTGLS